MSDYFSDINNDVKLVPDGEKPVLFHASQYDTGRIFNVHIVDQGEDWVIDEGYTATLNAVKPDGNVYTQALTTTSSYAQIITDDQLTAVAGNVLCEVRFASEYNEDIGTANFIIRVERSPIDDGVVSDSVIGATQTAIAELQTELSSIESVLASYADAAAASAEEAAASAETAATSAEEVAAYLLNYPLQLLDGTSATYKKVMRQWFLAQGIDTADPDAETLTALCDQWYALTRDQWSGYTEFYQPDVSAVTYGTKGGDNASLTCTPSTDTVEGTDDYAGLPLFACVDVNAELYTDDDGNIEPLITAIDGITSNFKRSDPDSYVAVMTMSPYLWWEEEDDVYRVGYSAYASANGNVAPAREAVKQDGTFREWMIHGKYGAGHTTNSAGSTILTCCSGQLVACFSSEANTRTYAANMGTGYTGFTSLDRTYLFFMMMIKYGSLTLDGILQGTQQYGSDNSSGGFNMQYYAQVAEEGVNRVLIPSGSEIEVGWPFWIGDYSSSTDRGSLRSISGTTQTLCTAVETVTVDDVEYTAAYFENIDAFDTGANGSATEGTTYISTAPWYTGVTDTVKGNDGSLDCTAGRYPVKLQGIEFMYGAYDVLTDCIANFYEDDDGSYVIEPYIVDLAANQSTSITSNYYSTGLIVEQGASSSSWYRIKKNAYGEGLMFPSIHGSGGNAYWTGDGWQTQAKYTGTRQIACFGGLTLGGAVPGLSCLDVHVAVGNATWPRSGRLSFTGNRGAWSA